MNSYLVYLIVCVVSFFAGFAWRLGVLKIRGKEVILPFIAASSRNFTLMGIGLALLSLFTIIQVERSNSENVQCQIEFQTVLNYNADISAAERPLNMRRDAAEAEADQALSEFVHVILQPGVNVRDQLTILDQKRSLAQDKVTQVEAERKVLTDSRAPYPAPLCGK